jgi:hypothetical protein
MRDNGLATVVATLLAAFATAHLMQFGLSAGRALSDDEHSMPIGLATLASLRGSHPARELPAVPSDITASVVLRVPAHRDIPRDPGVPSALGPRSDNGFGLPCARSAALDAEAMAMLRLHVEAPCDPEVRVEIRHAGVVFTLETSADGRIDAALPAMMAEATVEAVFGDGTILVSRTLVPDMAHVQRVAVSAEAWTGLSLHAFEFGALRGGRGHVHAGAEEVRADALHRLGDGDIEASQIAEVYTFPSGRFGSLGGVTLQIEAEVKPMNCARDVTADIVRSLGNAPPERTALRVAMPSCEGAGDILVVDAPPSELLIARN